MLLEIEKKFLVKDNFKKFSTRKIKIIQGYLSTTPERTVRVRIMGNKGFLTIKGKSYQNGTTRFEWEKSISKKDCLELMQICENHIIEKERYFINEGGFIFEVDEFYGANAGLIIAEIELKDVNQKFPIPPWLGKEITGKNKYYNSQLSQKPFSTWKK